MLKFFREYNKYILAVGVGLLMIAFLIQPTLSMFTPDPTGEVIGTLQGEEITLGDQRLAGMQMRLVQDVAPLLLQMAMADGGQPHPLQWLLIQRDAQRMGLSASDAEINRLLTTLRIDDAELAKRAKLSRVPPQAMREALRAWLVTQSYKELVYGLVHVSADERLQLAFAAAQLLQRGHYLGLGMAESAFKGKPRLSQPLLMHLLQDTDSKVKVSLLTVPADRYLLGVPEPTEPRLVELFKQYKGKLPGQSEPYGLGYRVPDRVKIEYLEISLGRVREKVRVEEAEALRYYDTHPEEFTAPQPADDSDQEQADTPRAMLRPYRDAREGIITRLKDQKATELAEKIIKTAQAIMLEDARGLEEKGGYRVAPGEWQPMPIVKVAQTLHEQFDVLPIMHHHSDQWQSVSGLRALPGIAEAWPVGHQRTQFIQYVMSAKEITGADSNHPLLALRLQTKLPSVPMVSGDGARYLFRLTDAQPSRVPVSLEDARDQVTRDAKRLEAYKRLKEDAPTWMARLKEQGIERLASETGLRRVTTQPFPKRLVGFTGQLETPQIEGIGQDEAFVGRVFDLANQVMAAQMQQQASSESPWEPGSLEQVSAEQRVGHVALDRATSLALVRVDAYYPMDRGTFENKAQLPWVSSLISQSLGDRDELNPLSIESLSQRVGFEPVGDSVQETDDGESEPADG